MSNEISGLHGARRAPGTTQSCKRFFPEEIDFAVSLKGNLSTPLDSFQCELSNLLGQQGSGFVNR
jgi:hypothetical protein